MIYSDIVKEGARIFNVCDKDIYKDTRFTEIMRARKALYLALFMRGASKSKIGQVMNRDHSTVMYGLKAAGVLMERDAEFKSKVEYLANMSVDLGQGDYQ